MPGNHARLVRGALDLRATLHRPRWQIMSAPCERCNGSGTVHGIAGEVMSSWPCERCSPGAQLGKALIDPEDGREFDAELQDIANVIREGHLQEVLDLAEQLDAMADRFRRAIGGIR